MSLWVDLSIVVLLVLLNAFFALSELAIVLARRGRLRQLADDGHIGAKLVLDINEAPASFLSTVQVGVTLNSILAGAFSGATLADGFGLYLDSVSWIAPSGHAVAMVLTVAGVTYLNLVVGELVPKRIALAYAEPIAVRVAFVMVALARFVAPVTWLLSGSTDLVLRLLRLHKSRDKGVTEDEVKNILAEGTESGALKPAERDMMEAVMRLADRTARSIMTPRVDMICVNLDDSVEEQRDVIRESRHSQFPVVRGDLEEILGIVQAKDLLDICFDGLLFSVPTVMRMPLIVQDTTSLLRLLDQFKKAKQHIAVVVDEYGSVEGLVSLTDIIESVTGGLPERGRETLAKPLKRKDGSWLFDGMTPIDEVEELAGLKAMRGNGDFETIAGFMLERLGRVPSEGDVVLWEGVKFEVMDMDARRVDKVLMILPEQA